jgi:hypothetical protein
LCHRRSRPDDFHFFASRELLRVGLLFVFILAGVPTASSAGHLGWTKPALDAGQPFNGT